MASSLKLRSPPSISCKCSSSAFRVAFCVRCCCNQSHVIQKGNPDKIPSKIIKKVPPRLRIMNHFLDLAPAVRASQPTPSPSKTHPALARSHLPGSERGGASWKKISPRGYFVTSFPSPCTARVTNDEPPFGTVIFWSLFSAPPTHGDSLFQSNRLTRRRGHLFHTLLVTFGALNTVIFTDFT